MLAAVWSVEMMQLTDVYLIDTKKMCFNLNFDKIENELLNFNIKINKWEQEYWIYKYDQEEIQKS